MSSNIRAQKRQSLETPSSLITSLPDDVIVDILARVRRCYYPTISLVSKHFRSLVLSRELYGRWSLLGCTEECIYAVLYNIDTKEESLYILHRKGDSNGLVLIQPLPPMLSHACFLAVGTSIYVFGGFSNSSCIDCRSHAVQRLPSMPMPMVGEVANIIDGKIYIIGYSYEVEKYVMVVFNTETQIWESEMTKLDIELTHVTHGCVVMPDKMYLRDVHNSIVYRPKENKWETDEMLNLERWRNACVIDDVMYYYDYREKKLRFYDPKQKLWGVVKAMEDFFPNMNFSWCSKTVNCGGKLAVLLPTKEAHSRRIKKIWFMEIAIERRPGGDIWGRVECFDVVFKGRFLLEKSL